MRKLILGLLLIAIAVIMNYNGIVNWFEYIIFLVGGLLVGSQLFKLFKHRE
jgi:hypothetical protein